MKIIIENLTKFQARRLAEWLEDTGGAEFRRRESMSGLMSDVRLEMTFLNDDHIVLEKKKGVTI